MTVRLTLPAPGQLLNGRYLIEKEIKGGTYGMVFKAHDNTRDESVAVKALLPSAASNIAVVQRFEREVQVVREIAHPNIIEIYDAALSPEGCLYYSMEFLQGLDLGQRLARGPLPPKGACLVAIQALLALAEAHKHDVIHRDLKPENIFLQTTSDGRIRIRVLDFGIAKIVGERGEALPRLTLKNEACGTPSYMAPEQIRGGDITPATDLLALGLLIYEMLTGQTAVEGKTFVETLRNQISGVIHIPDNIRTARLGGVLSKALEKDPVRRYPNAHDMRLDIEAALKSL